MADDSLVSLLPAFVAVPARPFLMGTPPAELSGLAKRYGGTRESYREESPQHRPPLPAFSIARTPVTNALYAAFVAATDVRHPTYWRGDAPPDVLRDHPLVDINWRDALVFCAWLTTALGDASQSPIANRQSPIFRLPTEAEWEHAARGADGRAFPWGEQFSPELANTREAALATTTPVGRFAGGASSYGALDMAGNVWEWTSSLDAPYPYQPDDGREDPQAAGRRILRGGCYANPYGFARCACRFRLLPDVSNAFMG
ncbi:MAG: formylglycine-generating enzyme family protein, partial [Chloroflexales bacterium]|nr:formylglycine-generating enzyme family protein [Chloroflexales bacterium]